MSANNNYYEILGDSENDSQDDVKKAYREAAIKYHPDKGGESGDPEKFIEQYFEEYENAIVTLMVSLDDLYNGASKKLPYLPNVICSKCNGTGETIDGRYPCQQCNGEKIVEEKQVLEVPVEKGMQSWQTISVPGDDLNTGVFFDIQEEKHPVFKRKGDDLFVEHTLSLTEALCGFQFELTHLDGRQLIIKSEPGEVVKPGQLKEIDDEGMPVYQEPSMRGKLYIDFTVEFPDSLTPDQSKAIEAVLPLLLSVEFPDSLTPDQSKAIEAVLPPRPSPQLTDMGEEEAATSPLTDAEEVETATSPLTDMEEEEAATSPLTDMEEEEAATSPLTDVEEEEAATSPLSAADVARLFREALRNSGGIHGLLRDFENRQPSRTILGFPDWFPPLIKFLDNHPDEFPGGLMGFMTELMSAFELEESLPDSKRRKRGGREDFDLTIKLLDVI